MAYDAYQLQENVLSSVLGWHAFLFSIPLDVQTLTWVSKPFSSKEQGWKVHVPIF